ncbi:protein kinase-like protein [Leishmania mexicana MHOM/GT/2001/U1103]|uniref:Protein kinase-like protein n=1 Tax=Leishmania mexicana (strain MHOM/GT/2001/U1103) TaxID=929439 RepID=E9ATK9_LEIMU|nr:protein kinase-like protein [Leishmania mexicana MHOM/GT/2001/U1103]CBZ26283.1 protein kinase-like protein [Leishmania mexicana MHOM/GT/2001/U1103]
MMKSYRPPAAFQQGRYIPNKVLGTGTYGQVIQCHDTVTGKDVAVKVAQSDAAYRRSALNEISALLCLKENEDSVNILDSFEDAGHVCIVSELLDRNLFEVLRHRGFGPLSLREVRQVALRVLRALASLHNSGYIHCDIKPENIMLRRSTPVSSNSSSPMLGSFTSENASSGSSNKSGEQNNFPNALAPGQEALKLDTNTNAHNQLWRNTNSIDSLIGNTHSAAFQDSNLNMGFSPRTGNRLGGYSQQQHGRRGSGDTTAAISGAGMRHSGSFDALFGMSAAAVGASGTGNNTRNDVRVNRNALGNKGSESQERTQLNPDANPYCRTCLIDFGAVRRFNENTYYDVQSLWYRAPEVLCGLPYTTAIDSWSVGCVLFELFTGKPLFPGESLQHQLSLIVQHVGHPSQAALTLGCLATQFQLPMVFVSHDARREHVRQWILSSRELGLQRWRKHQMQKLQEAHIAGNQQLWSHRTADVPSAKSEEDALLTATPYGESDVDGTSEELKLLVDLICDLLNPDESQRLSCTQALHHSFLNNVSKRCSAAPCPYTATPAACFPTVSAAPAPVPCIMATTTTGQSVMMTASPLSVPMGCSPASPFVMHPVHSAPAATVPFTVAPVESMVGVEMEVSTLGVSSRHQPAQAFSTYPAVTTSTVYTTNSTGQVMQCAVPVFTQVAHQVAPSVGHAFLPLGMTAQNPASGIYCSPTTTASQQQYPSSGMSISPTFSPGGALVHAHVPLGFTPTTASNPSAVTAPAASVQPLGASAYVLASAGTVPCIRDYHSEMASAGISPYVLCHFQPQHACATVMSP